MNAYDKAVAAALQNRTTLGVLPYAWFGGDAPLLLVEASKVVCLGGGGIPWSVVHARGAWHGSCPRRRHAARITAASGSDASHLWIAGKLTG